MEGTLGAAEGSRFRERPFEAALQGASRSSERGSPGALILQGFERSRRRDWYPASRCERSSSRARVISAGDRRCLGRSVWGKSTLAQEVNVGVVAA